MCGAPSSGHVPARPRVGGPGQLPGLSSVGGPGQGQQVGRGGPGRELLSAVNKQQNMELPGSLFWGMYIGASGGLACSRQGEEGTKSVHPGDINRSLLWSLPSFPPQLLSHWLLVPVLPSVLRWPLPPPEDHPHSKPQSVQLLFQSGSNQIYIQSKNSRKGE